MKRWTIVTAVVLGLGTAAFFWRPWESGTAGAAADAVAVAKVAKGNILQAASSTGIVASNLDVPIKCRAGGEVTQLGPKDRVAALDVSDVVKAGDLLLQIDPIDQKRAVQQAEVQLSSSQAKLAQAKQNLDIAIKTLATARQRMQANLQSAKIKATDERAKAARRKMLFESNSDTKENYDTQEALAVQAETDLTNAQLAIEDLTSQELGVEVKRSDVALAEAQVKADTISLDNQKQQLAYTTVTAPMDGVISALTVQKGTIISSAISNVGGGSTVMTLADLSRIFVLANVDESEIGGVRIGQTVNITADAFPGKRFDGTVTRIAAQGVNVSNVVTFEVKVEVNSENKTLLKPQMTTNVQIVEKEKHDVLVIPLQAVTRKDHKATVSVATGEGKAAKTEERPVQLGLTDGTNVEIASGLTEGETVTLRKGPADSRWNASPNRPSGTPMGGMGGFGGGGGRRN